MCVQHLWCGTLLLRATADHKFITNQLSWVLHQHEAKKEKKKVSQCNLVYGKAVVAKILNKKYMLSMRRVQGFIQQGICSIPLIT